MNRFHCEKHRQACHPPTRQPLGSGPRHLRYAGGTEPVPVRNGADPGPVAVGVTALVAAVTKEQQLLVISLPTNLAVLEYMRNGFKSGVKI